jgi:hypothetical protein
MPGSRPCGRQLRDRRPVPGGAMVPATRAVPPPRIWRGSGMQSARTRPTGGAPSPPRGHGGPGQPKMSRRSPGRCSRASGSPPWLLTCTVRSPRGCRPAWPRPGGGRDTCGQLGQLPLAQPCHSLRPQRLLPGVRSRDSTGFKREAVLIASLTRRQMLIHRQIWTCRKLHGITASTGTYE